jgi:predicted aldo/keto reductase-like oxidoreductase
MKKISLGKSGIEVSYLGFGTGTTDYAVNKTKQSMLEEKELAALLLRGYELGITHWDTATGYDTYRHIARALENVKRDSVVITTKISSITARAAEMDIFTSCKELGTDYIDICLLHGIRNAADFKRRRRVLDAVLKLKQNGILRAVGLSAHGIEALEAASSTEEIDVVWARMNHAGLFMDTREHGFYDRIASIGLLKKIAGLLPDKFRDLMRPDHETPTPVSSKDRVEIAGLLERLHANGKGVIGMKVIGEGHLGSDPEKALTHLVGLTYIDAIIVGMLDEQELLKNYSILNQIEEQRASTEKVSPGAI